MTGRGPRNYPRATDQSECLSEKKGRFLILVKEQGKTEIESLTQRNNNERKEEEEKRVGAS